VLWSSRYVIESLPLCITTLFNNEMIWVVVCQKKYVGSHKVWENSFCNFVQRYSIYDKIKTINSRWINLK
jgi:hypothetical protein